MAYWYLFLSLTVQHDTTIADMMSALKVYDGHQPEYASAFFIELLSEGTEYVTTCMEFLGML